MPSWPSGSRNRRLTVEATVPSFPLGGFRLYDDLVIVESIVGEQQLAEADDVARYEKYLELLREAASTGRDVAMVIQRSLGPATRAVALAR